MKNIFIFVLSIIIISIFTFTFIKVKENYNINFQYSDKYNNVPNDNTKKVITEKDTNDIFHLADIDASNTVKPILNKINDYSNYISIIIDDSGNTLNNVDRYFDLAGMYNITFAVLPDSYYSLDFSYKAYSNNVNVILHMPMEGSGYFGEQTLIKRGMSKDDIYKLLDYSFSRVPYAMGMNNHTGSLAGSDSNVVSYMLDYAKNDNKYFIDSYTSSDSLIYNMALEYGVKTARRSVFLDNERDYDSIMKQWRKLIDIAKECGIAIGIGHYQSEETLKILEYNMHLLKDEGIEAVNITEVLN
ncbi:divergent polysaccharide deacetylase family protein [Brachyspira sp.]|uniref:divergent polysaccharide deacetylase family protein n=1 Tax=Brachyspira sp. TaxID=1977261 RepID=UPI00260ADDAE|nr:divergent polysaccharide deacetylase family protein [Brachyspira sp.]